MQSFVQDPSHTGAALHLYDQLKTCFPNVSSHFITSVVTEYGSNPKYCFEKIREESRLSTSGGSAASTPTSSNSAAAANLPDYYYPWTAGSSPAAVISPSPFMGRGSLVLRRQSGGAPLSPVTLHPAPPGGVSPRIRYAVVSRDGSATPPPTGRPPQQASHVFGFRLNPPQRSSSMTFDTTTGRSGGQQQAQVRPPSSPQPAGYYQQQQYTCGSPLSGRQSPFRFQLTSGVPQQRFRLVPSPMVDMTSSPASNQSASSSDNPTADAIHRRPSFPLLTTTTTQQGGGGQPRLLINYGTPLNVVTSGHNDDYAGTTVDSPSIVSSHQPFMQISSQTPSIKIYVGSSSGGQQNLNFRTANVTFGPAAKISTRNHLTAQNAEYIKSLLENQIARRDNLLESLNESKIRLDELTADVSSMEEDLSARRKRSVSSMNTIKSDTITALHQETRKLTAEVTVLLKEVESLKAGGVPTNLVEQCNFHEHMGSTGPGGKVSPVKKPSYWNLSLPSEKQIDLRNAFKTSSRAGSLDSATDGEQWTCSACTFANHPLLKSCEVCDFPRTTNAKELDDWVFVHLCDASPSFFQ